MIRDGDFKRNLRGTPEPVYLLGVEESIVSWE